MIALTGGTFTFLTLLTVLKLIKKYEKDPSFIKIKEKMKNKNMSFSFSFITKETILNKLCKLDPKKACQESDIPVEIIKENLDIVSSFIYNNFNYYMPFTLTFRLIIPILYDNMPQSCNNFYIFALG